MQKDWFDSGISDRPAAVPLPSVLDLARHATAAWSNTEHLDDDSNIMALCHDRERALRGLLLTCRARTLGDAAAQLHAGYSIIANDMMDALPARHATALRRMFLSVLPVVADAAGVSLAEIGADDIAGMADGEFPA